MSTVVTHPQSPVRSADRPRVLADLVAGSRSREARLILTARHASFLR